MYIYIMDVGQNACVCTNLIRGIHSHPFPAHEEVKQNIRCAWIGNPLKGIKMAIHTYVCI